VALSPEDRRRHARVAAMRRWHPDRPDLAADDRRVLKLEVAGRYIRTLADSLPAADRVALAVLLLGGDAA
jgi:hypothetical protein